MDQKTGRALSSAHLIESDDDDDDQFMQLKVKEYFEDNDDFSEIYQVALERADTLESKLSTLSRNTLKIPNSKLTTN